MAPIDNDLKLEWKFFSAKIGEAGLELPVLPQDADEAEITTQILNCIFLLAIHEGASAIRFGPIAQDIFVQFSIEGRIHKVRAVSSRVLLLLIRQLKTMVGYDPDKKAVDHDSRIQLEYHGRNVDLTVYIHRDAYGESAYLRVLDSANALRTPQEIGLSEANRVHLEEWLNRPQGLIIVSGSTQSGTTTTLYSLLRTILRPDLKTMTIEDPISYPLPHATQVQMTATKAYAGKIREFLKHEPDVIVSSEARDDETLQVLFQAANAGHLVLTVMHVPDAPGLLSRIESMHIKPDLIASALIGVVATQKVRRLCPFCREENTIPPAQLERLRLYAAEGGYHVPENSMYYRGKGCDSCRQNGYKGFIGLYELMEVTPTLAEAMLRNDTPYRVRQNEFHRISRTEGMTTLFADGARKVVSGETTIEELSHLRSLA